MSSITTETSLGSFSRSPLAPYEQIYEAYRLQPSGLDDTRLAELARSFIDDWRNDQAMLIEDAVRFLVIITQLMEWKVQALLPLPGKEQTDDELLVSRVDPIDIEPLRQIISWLSDKQEEEQRMLRRQPLPPGALLPDREDPLQAVTYNDLHRAFQRILSRLLSEMEAETKRWQVHQERVSRSDCQMLLTRAFRDSPALQLEHLFRLCPRWRAFWVVVFILMLELVHQQKLHLHRGDQGEIWLSRVEPWGIDDDAQAIGTTDGARS